ncbi:LPXTG cell wall anchor domain-containing protein [[Ruminococcus] torques]|uniref:LPXTG cell wall anchor domain-containing protein n=1 Tax=[Ruminococcus] torques TaxID=33039 RepID=UPI0012E9ACFD|nr:LPXTG cell wall anchor domain-containing protein [Faecalicatena fissicatena]
MSEDLSAPTDSPQDKPDSGSPQTGDSSNVALWIAVMLISGTALTGIVLYNHKKKYSR